MSTAPEATPPPKTRFRFRLILIVAVVLLLGGGGGAYWMFGRSPSDAASEAEAKPVEEIPTGMVPLEPFVVNLSDPDGSRYLRVRLGLVVPDELAAKEISENPVNLMRVRSAVLELLALETAERLVTPDGKAELKKSIAAQVGHSVHDLKIVDVLFSEFVIQ